MADQPDPSPLQSPLHAWHAAHGAKLAAFGGWAMPLEFPGGGIVKEHTAVRSAVGVFDVSHLGKVVVAGAGARAALNRCLTGDLDRIGPGRAQYTLCCDDPTGGVVDDLIVYLRDDDELLLIPNAANTAEVARRLRTGVPPSVTVTDRHRDYAVLAVQGPRAPDVLADLGLPADLDYLAFTSADWRGSRLTICRTGYTGERGYELLPRWADAEPIWEALVAAAAAYGGLPCGLGARDTLRTEMGYPLHGQDLSLEITPVQARLGWAVGWGKQAFWGREALLRERAEGPDRRLWGIRAQDRGIPRPGMAVRAAGGRQVGVVTSGTFSPTLRTGIGLALLDRSVEEGAELSVDVRGRPSAVRVVAPPFVPSSVR